MYLFWKFRKSSSRPSWCPVHPTATWQHNRKPFSWNRPCFRRISTWIPENSSFKFFNVSTKNCMKNSPCRMPASRQSAAVGWHSREIGRLNGQSACQTGCPSRQRDSDARRRNLEIRTGDKLHHRLRWIWTCFTFLWKKYIVKKFFTSNDQHAFAWQCLATKSPQPLVSGVISVDRYRSARGHLLIGKFPPYSGTCSGIQDHRCWS